jgi:hypothetical protein
MEPMARKLLFLMLLTAPLFACGDPRRAQFEAAIQTCRNAYPMEVGTMVARTSCVFHERDRYGFRAPNETLVRSITMRYAAKVDRRRMSVADAYYATQQQLRVVDQ